MHQPEFFFYQINFRTTGKPFEKAPPNCIIGSLKLLNNHGKPIHSSMSYNSKILEYVKDQLKSYDELDNDSETYQKMKHMTTVDFIKDICNQHHKSKAHK